MSEKFTLTNAELAQLAAEISAFLSLKLNIQTKYQVTKLHELVGKLIKVYMQINNETIEELNLIGASEYIDEANVRLSEILDSGCNFTQEDIEKIKNAVQKKTINPALVQYTKKMKPLNEEVQEFEFKLLPFDWIKDIETEMNFPLLYRFFEITKEK